MLRTIVLLSGLVVPVSVVLASVVATGSIKM